MLFASTFTIGKLALAYTAPILFIGMRMLTGGFLLLGYTYVVDREACRIERKDINLLGQVSFFQYYAAFILEFVGLTRMTSAKVSLFWNLSPFVTALLVYVVYRESLSKKKILGLVIGFLGLLPMLLSSNPDQDVSGLFLSISLPEIILLAAVVCACYGWILIKQAQDRGYKTLFINGFAMSGAGIAALLTSFIVEGTPYVAPPASCLSYKMPFLCSLFGSHGAGIALFVTYSLLLILISNVICFNLYGHLLRVYSATFVSFAGFVTPLFAALYGHILLGEEIGIYFFCSLMIVCCGLLLFFQEELRADQA
jgi:drug/metabolite transporter (DMT)-like permease